MLTSIQSLLVMFRFLQSVNYFGFTLDCYLTVNVHLFIITQTCYFKLSRLASIHGFLTNTATAMLVSIVSALVLSRTDNRNSQLFGSTLDMTSRLQWIQNNAA